MEKDSEDIKYENRIVAFVDILGFKEIIRQSSKDLKKLELIYQTLEFLKKRENAYKWNLQLIEIEEDAQKIGVSNFNIDSSTVCTCFSDTIVVSVKCTSRNINEVISTLIANISYIGARLMTAGILLRGGITIGKLIHLDNGIIMGQGLIDAYQLEKNSAEFPRILISKKLITKLNYPLSSKNDRYPYHQYLERFEDGFVGFHQMIYFQVLQDSSVLNRQKLKSELKKVKQTIIRGLDDCFENGNIFRKYLWLKEEYEKLIILTDDKEKLYDVHDRNVRGHNIHYSHVNSVYENKKARN